MNAAASGEKKMSGTSRRKTALLLVSLIVLVLALSLLSNRAWGGKSETRPAPKTLVIAMDMTVGRFGKVNDLPIRILKEIFGLAAKSDLETKLAGLRQRRANCIPGCQENWPWPRKMPARTG